MVGGDWRVVPIPKKGDLRLCDNWHGISLLDVAGKVFVGSYRSAEAVRPESQGGFQKGRTRVDIIFVADSLWRNQASIMISCLSCLSCLSWRALWQ